MKRTRVNERINAPSPPCLEGDVWVDEESCVCGARYCDFVAGIKFRDGVTLVRAINGGYDRAEVTGGYRSRGPVLWAMHVLKLNAWYESHYACFVLSQIYIEVAV